jgi:D-alanine-D-alanine ligase
MKLAYLYTQSELTPWKENVNMNTLQFLMAHTPANIESEIVHFDGFNDDLLDRLRAFDLVFNLSYGYLEAGQVEVAGWLEYNGILHTASSFESLSKAQDKSLLPDICWKLGFNTPSILNSVHDLEDETLYLSKPRKGSCHRNISIEKGGWMKEHLNILEDDLLIQPYIFGREFSVAVIPDGEGKSYLSLSPIEIVSEDASDIYIAGQSFGKTYREFEPELSAFSRSQLMFQAKKLHKYLGLKGMSRTDFRMSADGTIFTLDVNAMPNMDPEKSLMPALCQHHGVEISDLINRMIVNSLHSVEVQNSTLLKEGEMVMQ